MDDGNLPSAPVRPFERELHLPPVLLVPVRAQSGAGEDVHDKWDNKLVESLRRELGRGYEVRYPIMPNEADPRSRSSMKRPNESFRT